ncbi:MAG: hypothetical protein QM679_02905 [Patulibacter sp.]
MAVYLVTAAGPVTLPGGRVAAPGEQHTMSTAAAARLIARGDLVALPSTAPTPSARGEKRRTTTPKGI